MGAAQAHAISRLACMHAGRGLIISWALPGQKGNGHINNHHSEYVTELFEGLGYTFDRNATWLLRNQRGHNPVQHALPAAIQQNWQWFEKSLVILRRQQPVTRADARGCSEQ